ncbi:MAG: hypothetical protein K6T91_05340 [Firmicutes bacterium]|nr:hypothetical protein [Bacillota bacterium]
MVSLFGSDDNLKIAFFWDESFLWGIVAYDAFTNLSLNFNLVTSSDIKSGALKGYDILFVPGGWASNKIKSLGDKGKENIQSFVDGGGSYLGICGGAGLALSHKDGLGLVPITRKPTSERVPSFSGKIGIIQEHPKHPIWQGIPDRTGFYAWWPGQFSLRKPNSVRVLASYDEPHDGAFVSDIPVRPNIDWDSLERSYGTNLNPSRIKGEPAVVEAGYGKGKVLLSYLHFETLGHKQGYKALLNILDYLSGKKVRADCTISTAGNASLTKCSKNADRRLIEMAKHLETAARDLISFGENNGLWYWRQPWILQWRRGVRGIEYCTLFLMLRRLLELLEQNANHDAVTVSVLAELRELALPFFEKARELLSLEKAAMNSGPISPLKTDNENIRLLREELFANSKSFGGYFKQIIDRIDEMLLPLLKAVCQHAKAD